LGFAPLSGDLFGDKILQRTEPFLQTFFILCVLKRFFTLWRFASASGDRLAKLGEQGLDKWLSKQKTCLFIDVFAISTGEWRLF
jgi:hypothetical protein